MPKNKLIKIIIIFSMILLLVIPGIKMLDPDFGWHMRLGEVIAKSGLPQTEPFSYAMPSYPYVDFEWLTNIIWYRIYPHIGYGGLMFLYAVMAVISPFIAVPSRYRRFCGIGIILAWGTMFIIFGLKAQVAGWLFWAIIVRFIWDRDFWKKWRILFPLLILFWSNLHASFSLGIVSIGLYILIESIKSKRINFSDSGIFMLGLLATVINPYGIKIWQEAVRQINYAGYLRNHIREWQPIFNIPDFSFLMAGCLSLILTIKYFKKIPVIEWLLPVIIFLYSFLSHRFSPVFGIVAVPVLDKLLTFLEQDARKVDKQGRQRFIFIYRMFMIVALISFILNGIKYVIVDGQFFTKERIYPVKAVEFLKTSACRGNLFTPYFWGGYADWQIPDNKIFIDGRMPTFVWQAPPQESGNVFKEYMDIEADHEKFLPLLNKYPTDIVLLQIQNERPDSLSEKTEKFLNYLLFRQSNKAPGKPLYAYLDPNYWTKIYQDDLAVIFCRINK